MRDQSILFNLQGWLATEAPTISIIAGGFLEGNDGDAVALVDNGGEVQTQYDRTDAAFQIITRSVSRVKAQKWANELAALMRGRFGGVTLPAATVEGIVYPAVTAWAFLPQSKPGYIGIDENRLHLWSANFVIVIGG